MLGKADRFLFVPVTSISQLKTDWDEVLSCSYFEYKVMQLFYIGLCVVRGVHKFD